MNGHQYALDVSGEWVDATRTEYVKHSRFFCDCPARHRMKLVKPSGSFGKRRFCDYVAHSVKRIKLNDGTSTPLPTCASGGESELHRKAKHVLREMVGGYSFATFRCSQCWVEEDEDTRGCSVARPRGIMRSSRNTDASKTGATLVTHSPCHTQSH